MKTLKAIALSVVVSLIPSVFVVTTVYTVVQYNLAKAEGDHPKLKCVIGQYLIGSNKDGKAAVTMGAKVINNGSPSIAWNWRLTAVLASGQRITVDAQRTSTPPTLVSDKGAPSITPPESDNLLKSLSDAPLSRGAAKTGWLVFIFEDGLYEELNRPGVNLILELEDAEGKTTSDTAVNGVGRKRF